MKKSSIIVILTAIVSLTACKKDIEVIPPPEHTSELGNYFSDNVNNAKQTFTIPSSGGTFTGSNGVIVNVLPNSFRYANGSDVSGNISFELVEVLDQASMIKLNKPTTSNGLILVSGGELKLTASQNGSQVFLKDGSTIAVSVPTATPTGQMALFSGVENSDGDVNWVTNTTDSITTVNDSSGTYYYFDWSNDSLGWINCDYFYSNPNPTTTVSVNCGEDFNQSNTAVFIHFTTINSVMSLYYDGTSLFQSYGIPIGMTGTIVCISEIDGEYFSNFTPISVTNNYSINLTMQSTTLSEIENTINGL